MSKGDAQTIPRASCSRSCAVKRHISGCTILRCLHVVLNTIMNPKIQLSVLCYQAQMSSWIVEMK